LKCHGYFPLLDQLFFVVLNHYKEHGVTLWVFHPVLIFPFSLYHYTPYHCVYETSVLYLGGIEWKRRENPLSNKKQEAAKNSKPYDSMVKALFSEQSEEIIACLLPGSHRPEGIPNDQLNVELNRNTLTIDIGRHIMYEEENVTFNLEAQSGPDDDLLPRMHEYAINLYRTYKRPVISIALLLFEECGIPNIPFTWQCGGTVRSAFYPIVICLWEKEAHEVVEKQQRCLYPFLPTMKQVTVDLLTRAVREMHEYDDYAQFIRHLAWFQTMLGRTTTISKQDKKQIQEVLKMQYQGFSLFREDPVIGGMILEGELKGKAEGELEGLRKAILDIADDLFSSSVVTQVQQAITFSNNIEKLRKFHRQIFRLSNDQEALALLTQYFPSPGEIQGLQEAILDIVGDRFSPQVVAQVQQAIDPCEDVQQLRTFLRQVVRLSDEQEVPALLAQFFPNAQEVQ
jgi:hypothetical protein